MSFLADLHIHSKYSMATAKNLDLPHLWLFAQLKGLAVLGTGDFTHPKWFEEIGTQLQEREPGLFALNESLQQPFADEVPASCKSEVRFLLSGEISSIYKKNGRTRKVHNLVFAPGLAAAEKIRKRLDAIGNISSDGRPILGLDSHDLLEIVLEADENAFLVPAHIWTPWFSLFGSKSGFDMLEECYGDLSPHIFALETGLSSDPLMNWRLSMLDGYTLISNSDAHSPAKLGREANLLDCELSFAGIRNALKTREGFLGTVEFYPEEGKYHFDGHRKCETRLDPDETLKLGGLCPVCGKPVTVGVYSRVVELADHKQGRRPDSGSDFHHTIPLNEVLAQVLGAGPNTKKVAKRYLELIGRYGPELPLLLDADLNRIREHEDMLTAEALRRVREEELILSAGYDGEYGTMELFRDGEREKLAGK